MTVIAVIAAVVTGGLAAVARWGVSLAFARRKLPWAVLVVNAAASAIGGAVLALAAVGVVDSGIRLILVSGVAGGLSTFSTWSVETIQLARAGRWWVAVGSVAANLVLGIAAAAAGFLAVIAVLG